MKKFVLLLGCIFFASPSFAQTDQTLVIYTYSAFSSTPSLGPAIVKNFERECGCHVKMVGMEDGVSLLNRIRLEGAHSKADIVLGLDNNLINQAKATQFFAPHGIDLSALSLPNHWDDPIFVPYDYGYFSFIYNAKLLKNPPHSFDDLLNRPELRIIYEDPRTSTPGLGLLLWVKKIYGDKSAAVWQQLAKQTVTVPKSWSEAYGLFLKGESDLVLSYTSSPAYHIMEEKQNQYQAAPFKEGHYLEIEVAARMKHAPHPKLARQFLKFILTSGFQEHVATGNWMYPVIKLPLPDAFKQLHNPDKALDFSAAEVAQHQKEWVREWRNAVSQ